MSVKAKNEIVDKKERMMINPTIEPWDIINIVNTAWDESFGRVTTNKKAISERGWGPFNRNLMTYTIIRATITEEEKLKEELASSNVILPMHKKHEPTDQITTPSFNPDLAIVEYAPEKQV